jgi:glycosyltransferase involved in cell wall biosynthesis
MKIVQVITVSEPIGGAQVHVRDLSRALVELGHEVTVFVGDEGLFTRELRQLGIECHILQHLKRPINPYYDILAAWEIRSQLAKIKPDLVATHSSKAGWLGRLAGYSLGIPTVFTAHGWAFTEGAGKFKQIIYALAEKLAAPLAAKIITVSDYDRNLALRYQVGGVDKLVTIHNGVPDVSEGLWAEPGLSAPRLIMVARLQWPKDHGSLLKALSVLRDIDWEMELVGDGPLRPQMQQIVADLRLETRVRFLGERTDVQQLLAKAQVFVLTSNFEGFPLSTLEAMRAKLPVIATAVGGVGEAVRDGVNGFLVPRGDDKTLAARLRQLLSTPELRVRFGETGRKDFEADFTVMHMVKETLKVYNSVLTK